MELSFVLKALRAKIWLVAAGAAIGLLVGIFAQLGQNDTYESTGSLNVLPPSTVGGLSNISASQLDRYALTQLSILNSTSFAAQVAKKVGGGMSAVGAKSSVTIERIPDSDIVTILAKSDSPKTAQKLSQAYLDQYLKHSADTLKQQQQPQIDELDRYIASTLADLKKANQQIASAMAPYLANRSSTQPVPTVDSIDPEASSQQTILLNEYSRLTTAKGALEYGNQIRLNSLAIQDADLPTEPATSKIWLAMPLGAIVGALLGMLAAVLAMTFSDSVLSESSVANVLKVAVAAHLGHDRKQNRHPERALGELPAPLKKSIDQLCVRAMAQSDGPMRIAVAGTQRGAGTTSLALAMAARYAHAGYSVVVADIDAKDPYVTDRFSKRGEQQVASVLKDLESGKLAKRALSATPDPMVRVLGSGLSSTQPPMLRNEALDTIIETAETDRDIVILDMGPVLESTTIRHVSEVVDSVVLAVPLAKQSMSELRAVRRILADASDRLLPVITAPGRRAAESNIVATKDSSSVPSDGKAA